MCENDDKEKAEGKVRDKDGTSVRYNVCLWHSDYKLASPILVPL